jgi:lysozyme
MSERGIEVLKAFESFRHRAYQDSSGGYYIGFGFQTWRGRRVTLGYPGYVTLVQAETELRHQLIMYEEIVRTLITISLMQHQFDALVSLAYNTGNLGGKRFITKVNSGNKVDERDFTRTVMAHLLTDRNVLRVLINRRKVEHQLYAGRR